jgi:putative salt-induced outer membrane protein
LVITVGYYRHTWFYPAPDLAVSYRTGCKKLSTFPCPAPAAAALRVYCPLQADFIDRCTHRGIATVPEENRISILAVLFLATPYPAVAQDTAEKTWSDNAELSYVSTAGNSSVETLAAKNLYTLKFAGHLAFLWKLEALKGKSGDALTAERYFTDLRLEHAYSPRAYTYLNTGWMSDTFAGVDKHIDAGLGGGYKMLDGPQSFLKAEAGVSAVNETYTDGTDRKFTEGRLFAGYTYAFTKKNKFSQSVEYLHDFDVPENYRYNSETALTASITDNLSLKVSYLIKYDHEPTPASLNTKDTIFSTALVAGF